MNTKYLLYITILCRIREILMTIIFIRYRKDAHQSVLPNRCIIHPVSRIDAKYFFLLTIHRHIIIEIINI